MMMRFLALFMLLGLLGACAAPPKSAFPTVTPQPTPILGAFIHDFLPPRPDKKLPHTDPCADDYDPSLVDTYNEALSESLARMLAEPDARALSDEQLADIFEAHAGEYLAPQLFRGGDYILTVLPNVWLSCFTTKYDPIVEQIEVMDWNGNRWPIGTIAGSGYAARLVGQWAGDRWLAVVNDNARTLCDFCYHIWQIAQEGSGWQATTLLNIGDWLEGEQWTGYPVLTQLDGYQRIALDLQPQYILPPCTFKPLIAPDVYMTWKSIRREYVLSAGSYHHITEADTGTHVVIYTPDLTTGWKWRLHDLPNWEAYCLPSSATS